MTLIGKTRTFTAEEAEGAKEGNQTKSNNNRGQNRSHPFAKAAKGWGTHGFGAFRQNL
jgi:hypothetical protein